MRGVSRWMWCWLGGAVLASLACYEVHVPRCRPMEARCDDASDASYNAEALNCIEPQNDGRRYWDRRRCYGDLSCAMVPTEMGRRALCVADEAPEPTCEGQSRWVCDGARGYRCEHGYRTTEVRCPYGAQCVEGEEAESRCTPAQVPAPYCEGTPSGERRVVCIEENVLATCLGEKSQSEQPCFSGWRCDASLGRCVR